MQHRQQRNTKSEVFAGISIYSFALTVLWLILVIGKSVGLTSRSAIYTASVMACMPIIMIAVISHRWDSSSLKAILVIDSIGFISWVVSKDASMFLMALVISLLDAADLRRLFRLTALVYAALLLLRIALGAAGLLDMEAYYSFQRGEHSLRFALGYGQPNCAQAVMFCATAFTVMTMPRKHKAITIAALLACNYVAYRYTGSRTGFYSALLIICIPLLTKTGLPGKLSHVLIQLCWIMPIGSLAICYTYNNSGILSHFDTASSRLLTGHNELVANPVSLFGTPLPITTDQGYIFVFVKFGIVSFVALVVLYIRLAVELKRRNLFVELCVLAVCLIYVTMESFWTTVTLSPSLLLIALPLFGNEYCLGEINQEIINAAKENSSAAQSAIRQRELPSRSLSGC